MEYTLDFEKPVFDLENQIKELEETNSKSNIDLSKEIEALELKIDGLIKNIYSNLTPWEKVQLSRHPQRPHCSDYIKGLISDFHEIHGDRKFADDPSVICGFGRLEGKKVAVIGIEKGRKTKDKIERNFGMARPEGYRKASRLMGLASNFNIPIISFIDTPGAYPGIGAEERGQAQAIAQNLEEMFSLKVPIVSVVIGEGGSGGALGIAIADKVLMQEYSIYSVISPESCASILWSNPKMAQNAANSLQLGPHKALELKVIDGIIMEPIGGAHRDHKKAISLLKDGLVESLDDLLSMGQEELLGRRFTKFRDIGNQTLTSGK